MSSSKIALYAHPQSPPCRSVTLVLDALAIKYEYKFLDLFAGDGMKPEYLALNPQHNIPFLVDGDFKLGESVAIIIYLGEKYGNNSALYPTGQKPEEITLRAKINQMLCFNSSVLWDSFAKLFVPLAFRGAKEIDEKALAKFKEVMGFFKLYLKETGYIAGTNWPTLADLACLSTFSTIQTTEKAFIDLDEYPEIVDWAEKVKKILPNYEEACGKGALVFKEFFKNRTGLIK